jgi:hypothetical protein
MQLLVSVAWGQKSALLIDAEANKIARPQSTRPGIVLKAVTFQYGLNHK